MRGRCDHDPSAPRLRLVVAPVPNQPHFIREAISRADRLYHRPRLFPELTGHSIAGRDARIRTRRSSRREAWALMAAAIARHTDRRTFRIGDQRPDGLCNGVSIERYCEETGLSYWRVVRTLEEFELAGYIVTYTQPVELLTDDHDNPILDADGNKRYRGFAAQRRATPLFFERLGFTTGKVKKARDAGAAAWRKVRARALSPAAIHATRNEQRRLYWGASHGKRMPTRYYEIELALKAKHPDWGIDRIRAEALRLLPR